MAIQNQGWAYVSGSGTGTPGGTDTQVQYNDDGSLQGSSNFTFDGDDVTVIGDITATAFSGDGSGLTNISSDDVDTTTDTTNATRYIPFVDQATGADGESLLIHSAVSINPSTGVFTIAGSAPSLGIGSAVLVEADMEKIDGIIIGTAAASKAVVLDASKNIATIGTVGCGAITSTGASVMGSLNVGGTLACDTSFTIDAVVLNATELGYVDGVTAGTAIASKAVVLDADGDVTGINNLTASFFKGDGSALTNLPGGGGGGGIFTELDSSNAYTTSSLSVGTSAAPGATLHVSSSNNNVVFRVDNAQSQTKGPALFVTGARGDGAAVQCLGIGTDSPAQALDVNGYITFGTTGTAYLINNGDTNTYIQLGGAEPPGVDGISLVVGGKRMLMLDENASVDSVTLGNDAADLIIVSGSLVVSGSISGSGIVRAASFAAEGAAVLGGSLTAVGVVAGGAISGISTLDASGLASLDGGIDVNGNMTVSTAGAIAGVTDFDGDGDLTMDSITMTGFTVDASGDMNCNGLVVNSLIELRGSGAISGGTSYSGSTTIQGASLSVDGDITCGTDIAMKGAQQISFGAKITGDQTLTAPFYRVYLVDTSTGQHDVTLPAISAATHGLVLTIKDAAANAQANVINITGSALSGDKIDGSVNASTLNRDNGLVTLTAYSSSSGTHVWYSIAYRG